MLIYQEDRGGDNIDKSPLGGVVVQSSPASSMIATIANPIIFYGDSIVINQAGHSGDLYNYYWTSYSRGTDGDWNNTSWHNAYLDGYIPLRVKSIYDPCPYLYRIPSNGTWNQFGPNAGWTYSSYLGGLSWNMATLGESWFLGSGWRSWGSSIFAQTGGWELYSQSTSSGQKKGYIFGFCYDRRIQLSWSTARSYGLPVRCIEVTRRYAHTFCQQKVCKNSQHFFLRYSSRKRVGL